VLFRHGDRTPINPYPKDPWGDSKFWTTGWGQLTNKGKQRHYELGQWIRNRYKNLIHETYSKENVHIQSTDVDRTLMSAQSNLAGLYPPTGADVWNTDVKWQPIPVHTIPEKEDYVLAAKKFCETYDYALNKLKKSDEYQELNKKLSGLYQYLSNNTGMVVNTLETVQNIYSCLYIEDTNNKTLPDWTKTVYPDKLEWVSARTFATDTYTPELARLKSGPLLKEILTRFQKKSESKSKPTQSLWIYSAHDTTVANFLNTLRIFEQHNPPFTATVLMELHMINQEPFIQIYYKNTTEARLMTIPNCGTMCKLSDMFKLYKDVLPEDWYSECKLSMLSMTYEEANLQPALALILCGALVILVVLVILSAVTLYRRRDYQDHRWYLREELLRS
jgi:lysosomal acid phosphatase